MITPTPFVGTPFVPGVIGTTNNFISSNSAAFGGTVYQPTAQIMPPVITSPIVPAVSTIQTTQNYQVFPPIAPTSATYFQQQPVSIIAPPLSSRGLLATGVRPITPPMGVGFTSPQVVGPVVTPGLNNSRILNQSRIFVPPGCCPECAMCGGCGMCGGYGNMGMCGPACGMNNCCGGYGCGGMGCGGMGCGCPFDETCRACCGCRCYY